MTGGQARLAAAVSAAYAALTGYQERAGEVVWPSPSRGAVEAMVRAQFARAEAAEAKLAAVAEHCRRHAETARAVRGGGCCPHLAEEILAITGEENDE